MDPKNAYPSPIRKTAGQRLRDTSARLVEEVRSGKLAGKMPIKPKRR